MNGSSFRVRHLQIPFRQRFSHASASRAMGDSVVVELVREDRVIGYGESCPRSYVTGENIETVRQALPRLFDRSRAVATNMERLQIWVNDNEALVAANPAAFCALELAYIDAFQRECGNGEASVFDDRPDRESRYSGVIGSGSLDELKQTLEKFGGIGFGDIKMKLSGDLDIDGPRIRYLGGRLPDTSLRLDANNLWREPTRAADYLNALPPLFEAVEEPLGACDYAGQSRLLDLIKPDLILDESFIDSRGIDFAARHHGRVILNFRVSKLGGVCRCRRLRGLAEDEKIPFIVGAQVGESGLLTRAALLLCDDDHPLLRAREGAAGEHLLSRDLLQPTICFGPGGVLRHSALFDPGRYSVDTEVLQKFSTPLEPGPEA